MKLTHSRRGFLGLSISALATGLTKCYGASTTSAASAEDDACCGPAPRYPIRLGGPIFNPPEDPEELAIAHRKQRYSAAYCPPVQIGNRERIRDIVRAFAKHDVVIAEVGRWCNLMDADPAKRKANLEWVCEGLALADELGALCCVNIAGSFNEKIWFGPHPKNVSQEFFDLAVENARRIIDSVNPKRAKFAYEMMGWCLPDSVDSYKEMLTAVDRPAFAVHLDPCNLVNSPRRFYENAALIDECFDKLGPWIVSCHAKDVAWVVEMQVHFREVVIGTGEIDYRTYLRRLAQLPQQPPLMMEHLAGPEEYARSRDHIFSVGQEVGVEFA